MASVHKRLQKVCVEGAVSCSTIGRWARHDDVAVHTQHRRTDANVERVKCDCGRYTGTASFKQVSLLVGVRENCAFILCRDFSP